MLSLSPNDDACIAKIFIIISRAPRERGMRGEIVENSWDIERSFAFSGFQMDAHQYTDEHEKYFADRMQSEIYQKRN